MLPWVIAGAVFFGALLVLLAWRHEQFVRHAERMLTWRYGEDIRFHQQELERLDQEAVKLEAEGRMAAFPVLRFTHTWLRDHHLASTEHAIRMQESIRQRLRGPSWRSPSPSSRIL